MILTDRQAALAARAETIARSSPYVLRLTERRAYTGVTLVVCERVATARGTTRLVEHGCIYGAALREGLAALREILATVTDASGTSLGLGELVGTDTAYRGNLPLNETAGLKLALYAKLHPQLRDAARIELMAWRIERLSREEARYYLVKVTVPSYGRRGIEWAKSGIRIILAGRPQDKPLIHGLIEQLRKD